MQAIKDSLDAIIQKRSEKAREQIEKEKELRSRRDEIEGLEKMEQLIESLQEKDKKLLFGSSKWEDLVSDDKRLVGSCADLYREAADAVHTLVKRFSRPTINLVVIGKIGAGKSKFLQSVSGLGNDCIPSLEGASCTGVTSIIENVDINGIRAIFTFKAECDVVDDINREIDTLIGRIYNTGYVRRHTVERLDKAEIASALENLREAAQGQCKANSRKQRDTMGQEHVGKAEELIEIYVNNWDEWYGYVGKSQKGDAAIRDFGLNRWEEGDGSPVYRYVLEKPEEIKTYVSKHGGSKECMYYRYIAVKEAVIQTRFHGIDARVRLIDTVGIGDAAADTKIRMEEAIRNESDAVIIILKAPNRTQSFKSVDREDISVLIELQEIYKQYRDKNAADWMAFLVNPVVAPGSSQQYLECLEGDPVYGGTGMLGAGGIKFREVVDIGRPEMVEDMLNCFLSHIAGNLARVDAWLEEESTILCQRAMSQEQNLRDIMRRVTVRSQTERTLDAISYSMKEKLVQLREQLMEYCAELQNDNQSLLRERLELIRKLSDEEDPVLGESLDSIINSCCIGDEYMNRTRIQAFERLNRVVRRAGAYPPKTQEAARAAFKRKLADCIVTTLGIDLSQTEDGANKEWSIDDPHFFGNLADFLLKDFYDTDEIAEAFLSLDQSDLDDAAGITKSLFNYHAARFLNPLSAGMLQPYQNGGRDDAQDRMHEPPTVSLMDRSMNNPFGNSGGNPEGSPGIIFNIKSEGGTRENKESVIDRAVRDFTNEKAELKREMKACLQRFVTAVNEMFDEEGKERFLVGNGDQMKSELLNLVLFLNSEQEEKWLRVFNKLYERGIICREDGERLKRLSVVAQQVQSYVDIPNTVYGDRDRKRADTEKLM